MGFRFDFEKKKITQTGGIFIKAIPKEVNIFLNDKLVKKTDFFFGSALIENLLPKKYKVKIEKKGYFSWEKELEVEEKKVTEVKNLILFPAEINFSPIFKNVEDFWLSPDGKKMILKEKENETWTLKLYLIENKIKSHLLEKGDISKEEIEILNLKFIESSEKIEIETKIGEEIKNFYLYLAKPSQIREAEKIKVPESILCYYFKNNNSYFLEKSGFFFIGDLKFGINEKLNEIPVVLQKEDQCTIEIWKNFIFLQKKDLFLFNPETKSFEKLVEGIKGIKIAPDDKKIAFFSNSEIWLMEENGEKNFLNRISEKIESLEWINPNYLIFQSGSKIKISETDRRDKINIFEFPELFEGKLLFNYLDKKIYLLREGIVYQSEPILK